jgi:hypothetical protein
LAHEKPGVEKDPELNSKPVAKMKFELKSKSKT